MRLQHVRITEHDHLSVTGIRGERIPVRTHIDRMPEGLVLVAGMTVTVQPMRGEIIDRINRLGAENAPAARLRFWGDNATKCGSTRSNIKDDNVDHR